MRRPPAGLAVLLAVSFVFTTAWALVVPAFQDSDEPDHFSYVQAIGENGRLPGGEGLANSSEVATAASATDVGQVTLSVGATPEWSRMAADRFGRERLDRRDGGGPNTASSYPPLYYALDAIPYKLATGGDLFTRLSVARIASGLFLLVTVTAAWLLLGELFDRRRLPQLAGAGTVAMWPMATMVSASINPDALMIALWTLFLWMAVKVIKRGITVRRAVVLGGVVGAACVTKAASLVLLPVLIVVVAGRWLADRRAGLRPAAVALACGLVPLAAWTLATRLSGRSSYAQAGQVSGGGGGFNVGEFLSYLWQFYLPRLDFMTPVHHQYDVISTKPVINLWLGTGSGVFGWVNVWFPKWVYWIVAVAVLTAFAIALIGLVRRFPRADRLARLAPVALLAGVALITLAALHYTDYRFYASGRGPFMHGRYLLPLAGVLAALIGAFVVALPGRFRAVGAGVWLGLLVTFQLASLFLVLDRWYVA